MQTLGQKERKDLFFQFFVLFTITTTVILLSLFLTQSSDEETASTDNEGGFYNGFTTLEKAKPNIIKLIDSVNTQAGVITTLNSGNSSVKEQSIALIDEFDRYNNPGGDVFIQNITTMLRNYIRVATENKDYVDLKKTADQQYEDCQHNRELDMMNNARSTPSQ